MVFHSEIVDIMHFVDEFRRSLKGDVVRFDSRGLSVDISCISPVY